MAFRRVRRQFAVDDICAQFIAAVRSGEFGPGDKLPAERLWAEMLGVGRPTIREAIKAMASQGWVETRQGSGTYVSERVHEAYLESHYRELRERMGLEDSPLLQLLEARQQIEPAMAALAAERATADDIVRMDHYLRVQSEAEETDHDQHLQADIDFHLAIAQATRNQVIVRVLSAVTELLMEGRRTTGMFDTARKKAIAFHGKLVDAIRTRDGQLASDIMRAHLADVEVDIRRALSLRANHNPIAKRSADESGKEGGGG